ncbi:MAG: hypothetical protein [Bacteriophage sp.]|nr:MAG: hypothetical protein [Bacteriophage sp.]
MENIVKLENGRAVVTSKELAERFGKTHRHVLRDIKSLECSEEFRESNFGLSSYTSAQNKILPCVNITRDGFCFLAMGFTGKESAKWKEAYIKAFNQMESILKKDHEEMSTMERANHLTAKIESDKQSASFHGKELQSYAKTKKQNTEAVLKMIADSQLLLGF